MAGTLASDVLKTLKKDHGETFAVSGDKFIDYERLPFGVFPLDLALGGGIPIGKISMVFGPESSGKTTVALLLVANFQRLYPNLLAVWIDAEWAWDAKWAARLGVDVEKVIVIKPEYGEQGVEAIEALVSADDVGLIVIDSIATLVPKNEIDGEVDRQQVGGNSVLITKMCSKIFAGLVSQSKKGLYPTIFCVNQIRLKIGVMYGDPETYPNGEEVLVDTTEHKEVEGFIPSHRLANVGMTAGFTHALPEYSNVKATVSLFMPCDIEEVDDTFVLVS